MMQNKTPLKIRDVRDFGTLVPENVLKTESNRNIIRIALRRV
jgi:hypothetical protein